MSPSKPSSAPDFTSLLDKLDRNDGTIGQETQMHEGESVGASVDPSLTPWKNWVNQLFGSFTRSVPFDAAWASAYQEAAAAQDARDAQDPLTTKGEDSRAHTEKQAKTRAQDRSYAHIQIQIQDEQEWVVRELGLRPDLPAADLHRIRRDFAKRHHPDRYPPMERALATRRMALANLLIDRHLKQRHD
ncbi:J domain-containing protein [Beijerinckia indica]|uniref:Heat shock protein DnaJ domain protein n=1 Tax=Beijerinckia indica subsp. indica (strain ATCC 9039 / DSM 1715 / NCIMB 8712) TaxID=395963 RepID=B2IB46_BEII9|nr:hypothetical protein [Beijerinckia indica]ACB93750.1 hypothetical protein Bind_0091 [Beijerinckia indica subsp. indica ATCC 9039]